MASSRPLLPIRSGVSHSIPFHSRSTRRPYLDHPKLTVATHPLQMTSLFYSRLPPNASLAFVKAQSGQRNHVTCIPFMLLTGLAKGGPQSLADGNTHMVSSAAASKKALRQAEESVLGRATCAFCSLRVLRRKLMLAGSGFISSPTAGRPCSSHMPVSEHVIKPTSKA